MISNTLLTPTFQPDGALVLAWDYGEYLKSDGWQRRRADALDRAGHSCQVCNSHDDLQVHHRTYERVGHEDDADLIVLCDACHTLFHERMAKPKLPAPAIQPGPKPGSLEAELSRLTRMVQEGVPDELIVIQREIVTATEAKEVAISVVTTATGQERVMQANADLCIAVKRITAARKQMRLAYRQLAATA